MEIPTDLNGFPVVACAPRKDTEGMWAVLVVCSELGMPYLVASWSPELRNEWLWGHYYDNISKAVRHYERLAGIAVEAD